MRGADCLAQAMAQAGVKVVFSLSGNQIMPVYDAMLDPGIRVIHTRHEAAAVFMADAYGQITGEIGVALVTAAPGFGNALGALYTASMSETPVVFLSGDSPVVRDGFGPFQEFPQIDAARPFVKKSMRPERAADLGAVFAEAVRIAKSGRPGPVHIALPFDVVNADATGAPALSASDFATSQTGLSADAAKTIREQMARAERPVIITGPLLNPSRAAQTVTGLEDSFGAPVICMESPRGLRDPALGAVAEVFKAADVVLYLGKPVDFTTGFGETPGLGAQTVMMVDPDMANLERARILLGNRLAVAEQADAPVAASALLASGSLGKDRHAWRDEANGAITYRFRPETKRGINPVAVADAIQKTIDEADDPVVILDGGEFGQWAQAFIKSPTRIINGMSGAIGGCLPYALAAKIARPDATVIVAMGDGTLGFHLAELETFARAKVDVTIVVGNDSCWNAEHQIQLRDYGPERAYGCDLNPDARYDLAAKSLGCDGTYVTEQADLARAIDEAVANPNPVLLDVRIEGVQAPAFSRSGAKVAGAH